jgi:hypothetical protein
MYIDIYLHYFNFFHNRKTKDFFIPVQETPLQIQEPIFLPSIVEDEPLSLGNTICLYIYVYV